MEACSSCQSAGKHPAARECPPWAGGVWDAARGHAPLVGCWVVMAREPPDRADDVGRVRAAGVSRVGGSRAKLRERRPLLGGVLVANESGRRSASGRRRISQRTSRLRLIQWLAIWLLIRSCPFSRLSRPNLSSQGQFCGASTSQFLQLDRCEAVLVRKMDRYVDSPGGERHLTNASPPGVVW